VVVVRVRLHLVHEEGGAAVRRRLGPDQAVDLAAAPVTSVMMMVVMVRVTSVA
jgi:hypothetical protein